MNRWECYFSEDIIISQCHTNRDHQDHQVFYQIFLLPAALRKKLLELYSFDNIFCSTLLKHKDRTKGLMVLCVECLAARTFN